MTRSRLSATSEEKLSGCVQVLQNFIHKLDLISPIRFTVVSGFRSEEQQNKAYRMGHTQLKFPGSKHNKIGEDPETGKTLFLSEAVDVAPMIMRPDGIYDIDWEDSKLWYHFMGIARGLALTDPEFKDVDLIWGGDWDNDGDLRDQKLMDLGHIETSEKE